MVIYQLNFTFSHVQLSSSEKIQKYECSGFNQSNHFFPIFSFWDLVNQKSKNFIHSAKTKKDAQCSDTYLWVLEFFFVDFVFNIRSELGSFLEPENLIQKHNQVSDTWEPVG